MGERCLAQVAQSAHDLRVVSDFNREFGARYELLTTTPTGLRDIIRRAVLVINPAGKIVYRWDVPDPPRLPTASEVLDALRGTAGVR